MDKRYKSGTSLQKTRKEQAVDDLESALRADFSDDLHTGLQALKVDHIHDLLKYLREMGEDQCRATS